jgi:hypothetical protein
MDQANVAGVLLNFGAVSGAMAVRAGALNASPVTFLMMKPLSFFGTLACLVSIVIFIKTDGLGTGLGYWARQGSSAR